MDLATFGAVLGFAVGYEEKAAAWCARAAGLAMDPALRARLEALGEAHARRRKLMERVRRENVTEMILEPISGLDGAQYEPDDSLPAAEAEIGEQLVRREELAEQFYLAAAGKVSIPEVARIFRRTAREIAEGRQV